MCADTESAHVWTRSCLTDLGVLCCCVLPMQAVTPPSTGVYDPIRAEWKVLPQRLSAAYTLDFAPRKLFEEKAFVKRSK